MLTRSKLNEIFKQYDIDVVMHLTMYIGQAKEITGKLFHVKHAARREGDPATLVADAGLAKKMLGWQPQYSALEEIIEHAWKWEMCRKR